MDCECCFLRGLAMRGTIMLERVMLESVDPWQPIVLIV
jgi:hypothetical protein